MQYSCTAKTEQVELSSITQTAPQKASMKFHIITMSSLSNRNTEAKVGITVGVHTSINMKVKIQFIGIKLTLSNYAVQNQTMSNVISSTK